jgi:DNA-binding Lrp family transcriptional regulator
MAANIDKRLIAAIQDGLPIVARPYAAIAEQLGVTEDEVIARITAMLEDGTIKRFGVVVRHRPLGYCANAMVVWDIPDEHVDAVGERFAASPEVTLCYRRGRRRPEWPYNLFCMVHGKDRERVLDSVRRLAQSCDPQVPYTVLFSTRSFKQRGAHYASGKQRVVEPKAAVGG